ncbi:MAG: dihydrofolate reductase family protein [Actinomyces bowdenii]|nr:dihydrofolate reductase family protein [Actinomyces bowdenii]
MCRRPIVLSTALEIEDPRSMRARSLGEVVALVDARYARQVYADGGRVIQSFLREDLIDEIPLVWGPVLLGSGLPLRSSAPYPRTPAWSWWPPTPARTD